MRTMKGMMGMMWLFLFLLSVTTVTVQGSSEFYMKCSEFDSPKSLKVTTVIDTFTFPKDYAWGARYLANQKCEWQLESTDADKVIKLEVIKSKMEGRDFSNVCSNDYVNIYDVKEDGPVYMDRFCGEEKGKTFESSSSKMVVEFISNVAFEFQGFKLSYKAVPKKIDDENETGLAIGIPVGVILACGVAIFIAFVYRNWRSKQAHPHQNMSESFNTPRLQPQIVLSDPRYQGVDFPSMYSSQYAAIPPPIQNSIAFQDDVRSATPPPSYDYLVTHEGLSWPPDSAVALCPPDYEAVVKENSPQAVQRDSQM